MTNWLAEEAGLGVAWRQCAELLRRGLGRPWLALLLTVLVACPAPVALAYAKRAYAPRLTLRVVEPERDSGGVPRFKRQLAEYLRQAVFTSTPLLELIRRHGLYPVLAGADARGAVDAFKRDISVDVYQNYFVEDRAPGDAPRSARVTLSYRSNDATVALDVTRELGALIVRHELGVRREQALAAARDGELSRETWQRALQRRSAEVAATQVELARSVGPNFGRQVQLVGLVGSLGALEREADLAGRRADTLALGAALERRGIGLSFAVVDEPALPGGERRRAAELLAGCVSFVLGFPLVALTLGAFQRRRGSL
jgi:hypothetical protein